MKSISHLLQDAAQNLAASGSPKLDAELLMAHVLQKPRTYLYTWPEQLIEAAQEQAFLALVQARQSGEPIAYLLQEKEFWSLPLKVNSKVLIPRPDTEVLVETVLELVPFDKALIADLGTGSGAIALALASERAHWQIVATDYSEQALKIAEGNAKRLKLDNIDFSQGSWCEALPSLLFDAIASNPPYIDENDAHLTQGDLRFEPRSALVAENQGLADIESIAKQAKGYLKPGGYLMVEHGYEQADAVQAILLHYGYQEIGSRKDLSGHTRVSFGLHN
ncbi:MAG: prmC [Gammaproteobacteria bacterium]|jgi:release factor glutamine methyltransferase|nr:prmC [Gammaproteobacteria bacterium]